MKRTHGKASMESLEGCQQICFVLFEAESCHITQAHPQHHGSPPGGLEASPG